MTRALNFPPAAVTWHARMAEKHRVRKNHFIALMRARETRREMKS